MSNNQYKNAYSDKGFWEKIKKYAKTIGESVLETALKMYYAAQDPDTPAWAKAAIYAALGYLILPLDAIPDLAPIGGYADDGGVLAVALATVAAYIKQEHTDKAKETLKQWFS
ncbi:DUF1232 domain-containing protein [Neisseria sp. Dent CA1/247]|uniref:YkvA family protein n=1 Tax=Neisseria sp. Dent CA1/247 TaxID=2912675 RepID=UPI001FD380CA|nr:DUF1232 domain-containing protein [Neisseria sp. Dent CA1/247]UOO77561.1 DUF1232 domain-containing protein [Neisseria sp. Dent CA1/247]